MAIDIVLREKRSREARSRCVAEWAVEKDGIGVCTMYAGNEKQEK